MKTPLIRCHLTFWTLALVLAATWHPAAAQTSAIPYEQIRGPLIVMQDDAGRNVPLAPDFTRFNVILTDGFAQTKVTQVYVNRLSNVKDMAYVFPLPHDGAVHGMRLQYKDSLYVARILEKTEAQRKYDSLVRNGGQGALLVQNRPNVFEQRIATLKKGDTATVEIEVSSPLKYVDGVFEFTMPTLVAERYGEGVPSSQMGWNPPANRSGQSLQFNVVLQTGYAITGLNSPTHPIVVQNFADAKPLLDARGMAIAGARLSQPHSDVITLKTQEAYPNQDFVLRFKREAAGHDFSVASHWLGAESGGYFAFSLYPDPEVLTGTRSPIECILLVDISGSQYGWPLEKEKAIAQNILNRLLPTDRLSVMAFNTSVSYAFAGDNVVAANSANVEKARRFVDGLVSGGGTELLGAVKTTLNLPQTSEHARYYVFLTDGFITDEDAIFEVIRNHPSHPTIFTFGAGDNLNRHFLETSAAIGNGFATELTSSETVAPKVEAAWNRIESPQLTELELDFGGAEVSEVLMPVSKRLYKGLPYLVYGRYAKGGSFDFALKAQKQGTPLTLSHKVLLDGEGNLSSVVPKLWARTQIGLLRLDEGVTEKNKTRIINLSVEHQVLSDYTAFLAIKPVAVTSDNAIQPNMPTDARENMSRRLALSPFSLVRLGLHWLLRLASGEHLLRVDVIDVTGHRIKTWQAGAAQKIGQWEWDGKNDRGETLRSGTYWLRLVTTRGVYSQPLVVTARADGR